MNSSESGSKFRLAKKKADQENGVLVLPDSYVDISPQPQNQTTDNQKDINPQKTEFERISQELFEANQALATLAKNIESRKNELARKVSTAITSKILPIIEDLKKDVSHERTKAKLDILLAYLAELAPGTETGDKALYSLSTTELEVAMMIRNGLTSKKIALQLHVSLNTINTHRRNIRKKLNINNKPVNLATFLRSQLKNI